MGTPFFVACLVSLLVSSASLGKIKTFDGLELPDLNGPAPVPLSFEESNSCGRSIKHCSQAPGLISVRKSAQVNPTTVSMDISRGQHSSVGSRRQISVDLGSDESRKRSKLEHVHMPQASIQTEAHKPQKSGPSSPTQITSSQVEISENVKQLNEAGQGITQSTSYDSRGKETSETTPSSFNVYNWDFLIARELDNDTRNEPQKNKLVQLFKTFGFQETGGFYWVNPSNLKQFRKNFNKQRHEIRGNSKIYLREESLGKLVLTLSDEKLALDRNPTFRKIMSDFNSRIEKRNEELETLTNLPKISNKKIKSIQNYISSVTKMSTFLAVVHLSLFKQHDVGDGDQLLLSQKTVQDILLFIEDFWIQAELTDGHLPWEKTWAIQLSEMLRLRFDFWEIYPIRAHYHRAWSLVEYWAIGHGKKVIARDGPTFPVELVNIMLIYLNPAFFLSRPEKN
ncbi:hypothetical protein PtA15_7A653 [Puccinia triticina]|uniref:Uncharacterized protein n=1 Tax=Puccinia triticina TaxID=208348 RepID=A0ABY7CNT9_9BASI|nr:uncharacterized protein PtA15_7A653 [Puccinia triticina]WAQ86924.1 hypothetical protein PtA15_7A653 [Puccinia triticina]